MQLNGSVPPYASSIISSLSIQRPELATVDTITFMPQDQILNGFGLGYVVLGDQAIHIGIADHLTGDQIAEVIHHEADHIRDLYPYQGQVRFAAMSTVSGIREGRPACDPTPTAALLDQASKIITHAYPIEQQSTMQRVKLCLELLAQLENRPPWLQCVDRDAIEVLLVWGDYPRVAVHRSLIERADQSLLDTHGGLGRDDDLQVVGDFMLFTSPQHLQLVSAIISRSTDKRLWDMVRPQVLSQHHLHRAGITAQHYQAARSQLLELIGPEDPKSKRLRALMSSVSSITGYHRIPRLLSGLITDRADVHPGQTVLVPNAREGDIATQCMYSYGAHVIAVEQHPTFREILRLSGIPLYDSIPAHPVHRIILTHMTKPELEIPAALRHLTKHGKLVAHFDGQDLWYSSIDKLTPILSDDSYHAAVNDPNHIILEVRA